MTKEFIYHGLGFPITMRNVPTTTIRGVVTIDLDLNEFQRRMAVCLVDSPDDLSTDQTRFIRNWLGLTELEYEQQEITWT